MGFLGTWLVRSRKSVLENKMTLLAAGSVLSRGKEKYKQRLKVASTWEKVHVYFFRFLSAFLVLIASFNSEILVSSEMSLISSPFILYPGAEKTHSLTLVVPFSQERLEAALDRMTQEQLEVEDLEAVMNEERATWKVKRHYSWGSSKTTNWAAPCPITRRPLPPCYLRINESRRLSLSPHSIPFLLRVGSYRVDTPKWKQLFRGKNIERTNVKVIHASVSHFSQQVWGSDTSRRNFMEGSGFPALEIWVEEFHMQCGVRTPFTSCMVHSSHSEFWFWRKQHTNEKSLEKY